MFKHPVSRVFLLAVLLPGLLATATFLGLRMQPERTWRRLMPSADFAAPQRSLKALVLSRGDLATWHPLTQSHYFRPAGGWQWLVLSESVVPRNRAGEGRGLALAVDAKGNLHPYRGPSSKNAVVFESAVPMSTELKHAIETAVIIAEDAELFSIMQQRVPGLKARGGDFYTFETAKVNQEALPSKTYGTSLKLGAIWRSIPLFSLFLSIAFFLWRSLTQFGPLDRLGLITLTIPLSYTLLALVFRILNFLPGNIPLTIAPYAIWSLGMLMAWKASQKAARSRETLWSELVALGRTKVAALIAIALIYVSVGGPFFTHTLSSGDACVTHYLAGIIYETGRWGFGEFSQHVVLAEKATYSQGISVLLVYFLKAIGPDAAKLFFPGQETGSLWLLFGGFVMALQVALLMVTWSILRMTVPKESGLQIVVLLLVAFFVPSVIGVLHASEVVLWPLFGIAVMLLVGYASTGRRELWVLFILMAIGLYQTKKDAILHLSCLLIPFMCYAQLIRKERLPIAMREISQALLAIGLSMLPVFIHQLEAKSQGLQAFDFVPVSVGAFRAGLARLPEIYERAMAITLAQNDNRFVEYVIPFFLGIGAYTLVAGLRPKVWQSAIVPLSILAFVALGPLIYTFSNYGDVTYHIATSWGRLVIPVYVTLIGWFILQINGKKRALGR